LNYVGGIVSDQNSGGGCLLFLFNWIYESRMKKKIQRQNEASRGLEYYQSITPDLLFPVNSFQENIIISGGETDKRMRLAERTIINCHTNMRAMIVLHLGNTALENIITSNGLGITINKNNNIFDAFTSLDLQEICQLVFETNKGRYDIKPAGRYILEIVFELLVSSSAPQLFYNYSTCPFHNLSDKITDSFNHGKITLSKCNDLNSLLMMGQAECAKIDQFFYDMKAQLSHIATTNANKLSGVSVISAIKNKQIVSIDLNSSANIALIELIVNSLTIAMSRGYEFSLFIDDVAIANNELLKNALCQRSNHNNIICSKDLYALLQGKDDVFTTLTGGASKVVLFAHGSHISCEKWSKYIGEYEKIETEQSSNSGWNQSSRWGYNANHGKRMVNKREYKIKPEQINRLAQNQIFAYDNQTSSLIQSYLT